MANKKAEILTMEGQVVSPITLATNVLLEDGRTAQDLLDSRDESMFSPTITTSSSISKVGQGDNVDFSENVIDGAYKSCVLKGRTLVNYNAEGNDRNEYVCMPSVEGESVTVNGTVEGKVKSAILSGNTESIIDKFEMGSYLELDTSTNEFGKLSSPNRIRIKHSIKKYVGEFTVSVGGEFQLYIRLHNHDTKKNTNLAWSNTHSLPLSLQDEFVIILRKTDDSELTLEDIYNAQLTTSNGVIEGMQSVKMPVLTTRNNLNLLDTNPNSWISTTNAVETEHNIIVSPNKIYSFHNVKGAWVDIVAYNDSGDEISKIVSISGAIGTTKTVFTTPNGCASLKVILKLTTNTTEPNRHKLRLFEGETDLGYPPYSEVYKSNILSTSEDVILRGIGDVKDTLDLVTGEYVQRICVKKFNELEWTKYTYAESKREGYSQFIAEIPLMPTNTKVIFDVLPTIETITDDTKTTGLLFEAKWNLTRFRVSVSNDLLTTIDENGLLELLNDSDYLITVETPAIKTVDLKGQKVYSYNDTTHYTCSSAEGSLIPTLSIEEGIKYQAIIKPSTKYSIVFNRTVASDSLTVDLGGATANVVSTAVGKTIVQITTLPTLSHNYVKFLGVGNAIKDVQVIEGDVVGDEPYFEGMCDVEMPVLTTTGKNLFNGEWELGSIHPETGGDVENKNCIRTKDFFVVESNKEYTISNNKGYTVTSNFYDYAKNLISTSSAKTFITPSNSYFVKFRTSPSKFENDISIKFQIEQGSVATPYEPFKSNILSTPQDFVLGKVEEFEDTINTTNGELIIKTKEISYTDSKIKPAVYISKPNSFYLRFIDKNPTKEKLIISDTIMQTNNWGSFMNNNSLCSYSLANANLYITIPNATTVEDADAFLTELNPTFRYVLAESTIKTVDLKQHPFAYKDGYVVLTSSSEEVSLTPTIEYSLIANRLGQIQSNQKLIEKQQTQIDELESMVVANLVNTQYQQALNEIKLGVK